MTLTGRLLPRAEWRRLSETGVDLSAWLKLPPETTAVVVVEDGPQIVACWTAVRMMHVEGFWVAPEHRQRGAVLRRLLLSMRDVLRGLGITTVLTLAATPDIRAILQTARATHIPGDTYRISIVREGDRLCQSQQQ